MTNWQPIETAPKDGRFVLGFDPLDSHIAVIWWCNKCGPFQEGWKTPPYRDFVATHWMPLPLPPEAGNEPRKEPK